MTTLLILTGLSLALAALAWIADLTEPDHRLYIVDDEAVRKLGEL